MSRHSAGAAVVLGPGVHTVVGVDALAGMAEGGCEVSTGEVTIAAREEPLDAPRPRSQAPGEVEAVELPLSVWTPRDFDTFAATELPALVRYAVALSGDEHLAHDMVQEAMVRAYLKWPAIRDMERPGGYVRRIVTNQYLSWRQSWHVRSVLAVDDAVLHARARPGADVGQGVVERDALWTRLGSLPRKQRAVLVLRYYEGLPDAEIAETLGASVSTVRSHASRALATLRRGADTSKENR